MPNVSMSLTETSQSVARPIIFDIIEQVKSITLIPKETSIYFPGDTQQMYQPGTALGNGNRDANLGSDRIIFIEVKEETNENGIATAAVGRVEHASVFADEALNVYMAPVYSTEDITIDFKYRTKSKTEAGRWIKDVEMRVSQLRDVNIHDITYHYVLPTPYLHLLQVIHTLRENVDGYDETFVEYITSHASSRMTLIGDLDNHSQRLAISEKQCRIVGRFSFSAVPDKPERDQESVTWTVTFSYLFSYEKPVGCNIRYPIMIHNQLLPPEYAVVTSTNGNEDNKEVRRSLSFEALSYFEAQSQLEHYLDPSQPLCLPVHDEFIGYGVPPGTGTILTVLCEVDPTAKRGLLNLRELGPMVLDPDILQFIAESEYPFIGKFYQSILQLNLYRENYLAANDTLVCTNTLDVSSRTDLSLRRLNRLRLSVVTDLTLLPEAAIRRLRRYPRALIKLIGALNEVLRDNPGIKALGDRKVVAVSDFSTIYRFLTGIRYNDGRIPPNYFPGNTHPGDATPVVGANHPTDPLRYIRGDQLEDYRTNQVKTNTVMTASIVAMRPQPKGK